MDKYRKFILAMCCLSLPLVSYSADTKCHDFPNFSPKSGPMMRLNCDFHHLYNARVQDVEESFGAEGGRPVILSLADKLILKVDGKRDEFNVTPAPYSELKAFSHAVFSVYLILSAQKSGELAKSTRIQLEEFLVDVQQAKDAILAISAEKSLSLKITKLYAQTTDFITQILAKKQISTDGMQEFYQKVKPTLLFLNHFAANLQIAAVDKLVTSWLEEMPVEKRTKLGVVVAVSHQARARSILVSYFLKKLKQKACVGALCEKGIVVIEDHFSEDAAQSLLARHFLDREAAQVIFNNPSRLQYDLLANKL